jgi:hypothetical protein
LTTTTTNLSFCVTRTPYFRFPDFTNFTADFVEWWAPSKFRSQFFIGWSNLLEIPLGSPDSGVHSFFSHHSWLGCGTCSSLRAASLRAAVKV